MDHVGIDVHKRDSFGICAVGSWGGVNESGFRTFELRSNPKWRRPKMCYVKSRMVAKQALL